MKDHLPCPAADTLPAPAPGAVCCLCSIAGNKGSICVHQEPPGPDLQSCFPVGPWPVPVQGFAPPEVGLGTSPCRAPSGPCQPISPTFRDPSGQYWALWANHSSNAPVPLPSFKGLPIFMSMTDEYYFHKFQ